MARSPRLLVLAALSAPLARPLPAQDYVSRPPNSTPGFMFGMPRVFVGIRGGLDLRRADAGPGDFYDFVTGELTLDRSDFHGPSIGADLGVALAGPVDLVLSLGHTATSAASEFRDWVDQNDNPIAQTTTLSTLAVTAAARWNLTARGRRIGRFVWIPARVLPYVGLGAGAVRYSLAQDGYFVDAVDLSIFRDRLTSGGWTHLALVMAGVDYGLSKRLVAAAEARYLWANADLQRDFVSFDSGLDLSGLQVSLGLRLRM